MKASTWISDNVGVDEQRKVRQHEQVKQQMREGVHRDLEQRAAHDAPSAAAEVDGLAHELKQEAVREVAATESELTRARGVARLSQVIDYAFFVLYGLIGLLIVLELLGARDGAGFKQFLNAITLPALAPFRGLMPDPALGSSELMLSYVIGLVVYVLLHVAINGALRLFVARKTAV
jgi:uncharacterized protein YggT (Ycf19 family)